MLKALILQFHLLGKTQEEWEMAWDVLNRREYPSLMAFADKVKEIQTLTGKPDAAALVKVKRYANNNEFQIIRDANTWCALETALKDYTARENIAQGTSGVAQAQVTVPAVPFMAMQELQQDMMAQMRD